MRINKNYFLILFIFLLSGCTVNYDIEISKSSIKEVIEFSESTSKENDNILYKGLLSYKNAIDSLNDFPQVVYIDSNEDLYDSTYEVEGVDYYDKEIILNSSTYGIKADFTHKLKDYNRSNTVNKCYKNISVLSGSGTLTLSTSRENLCFEQYKNLETININMTINPEDYAVISSNADEIVDNKYTWNINRQNYNNKSIVIELESLEKVRERQNAIYVLIGFVVIVSIIAVVVYLFIKNQSQRKNEI